MSTPEAKLEATLEAKAGWLHGIRHVLSPNCNDRPAGAVPELIIVHNISLPPGEFGSPHIEQLFCNTLDCSLHPYFDGLRELEVSAHFLIDRNGAVTQFVACSARAWHAGQSNWAGRSDCNDFSIGIELEGTDVLPYTDHQYRSLSELVHRLRALYPSLAQGALAGHSDVAPGRKTDPGAAFDWARLRRMLRDR